MNKLLKYKLEKLLIKHKVLEQFKDNLFYHFLREHHNDTDVIMGAFSWQNTKEGIEFWAKLNDKLNK